jgi:methylase of polypeptide subunit release factors
MRLKIAHKIIFIESHSQVWMPTEFGITLGEHLLNGLGPEKGELVLDLGVGSGILSILCGLKGASVVALDLNPIALAITKKSWRLNGLPEENVSPILSDLFKNIPSQLKGEFDLIVSNPPTFPQEPQNRFLRQSREEWEFAGREGREILDALLIEGRAWLKPNGRLITICTSRQNWKKTEKTLQQYWQSWKILEEKLIPLANYYHSYLPLWREQNRIEPENPRIVKIGNQWHQRLYFIEAVKAKN